LSEKKTIVVLGATGAQGGGLARAILNDKSGEFALRAVTRDPKKAADMAAQGAEVVTADLDDVESLKKAFAGAYGAFAVTNFWEHFNPGREIQQARNIAEAAKAAGLKHVVWSTLEDTRDLVPLTDDRMPTLMEHFKVPHFDTKGEANHFFKDLGVPTTYLYTSFYWDNLVGFGMGPKPGPDGKLAFVLPMGEKKLPGIAAEDIGKSAFGIFKQGDAMIGQHIGIAGEHLTGHEMAAALGRFFGREVAYGQVTPAQYRGFGFPGADDLGNMFQYKADFEDKFCAMRDLARAKQLNPEMQTFDAWLQKNGSRIPMEEPASV
jgi:uncharacterized protein YbjT (DUF2867 family)